MTTVIEVQNAVKTFRAHTAVDNVSFTIEQGSITALLGPNGAGKTTTMSMLLGLLEPTAGSVKLLGGAPTNRRTRDRIGAMLQEVAVMDGLRAVELIDLFRSYYSRPADRDYLIRLTGLGPDMLKRNAQKLSGGQKRSLGFALAMAGDPDILFFDEPTVGLDTTARRLFWNEVRQLAKQGKTVLFSTHYLEEADREADRILLFDQGRIVADGTPDEIKRTLVKRSITFRAEQPQAVSALMIRKFGETAELAADGEQVTIAAEDTDAVMRALIESGLAVRDIRIDEGRLDAAFEQLTHAQTETNETREAI
ncbi:ABC transporter ATP-binding protein [Saccharibacillus sp. O23]|uniref:ABC transporter ATP-binding protein n=1 Tax=Saccharibacillus sp. O23 TaxID=2009338 RepID=UPI000B4E15AD|nr:ABC transporter ATP-binding protein [Saccharibacillus sp. O23]OWR26693.1 ABC transporter ATP-binding protein [Saccharibacillus sp. O23]